MDKDKTVYDDRTEYAFDDQSSGYDQCCAPTGRSFMGMVQIEQVKELLKIGRL